MAYKIGLIAAVPLFIITLAFAGIDENKLVDLTYPLDEQTVFWPTNKPFTWEKAAWGRTANGYWYASGDFSMSEHGGTHIDAPIHFAEGRLAVDEITTNIVKHAYKEKMDIEDDPDRTGCNRLQGYKPHRDLLYADDIDPEEVPHQDAGKAHCEEQKQREIVCRERKNAKMVSSPR